MKLRIWFSLAFAQDDLLTNTYNRSGLSLNGEWHYIVDPYENGHYNNITDIGDE